ncbi:3-deoxy-D-manno-octulosonic acid transferase [Flavobacteriales bacterium]|nr:3-deoxy-D-manno-octulosonic acid transferase [Flavobacteriales bacterium]
MGKFLYNIGIVGYLIGIYITAPFNKKARLWINGRKNQVFNNHPGSIWFHCASLGEFEQARPVIEGIKRRWPKQSIVLTFFSPSGYENKKDYPLADEIYYLPIDSSANASKFLDSINPRLAIFVKYEVWHHFFKQLKIRNTSLYLIAATFRPNQIYFKSYGGFMFSTLQLCTKIFTQDNASLKLLESKGEIAAMQAGDTRYDRVIEQRTEVNQNDRIAQFKKEKLLVILGSSWQVEEELIMPILNSENFKHVQFIIAPHDVSDRHVNEISKRIKIPIDYYKEAPVKDASIMILNTIGQLASAYYYADVAVIGGGFTNALHNILEPATFGIPVVYGNNHSKYPEGKELVESGGGYSVSRTEFSPVIKLLVMDESKRKQAGTAAKNFVESRSGATAILMEELQSMI